MTVYNESISRGAALAAQPSIAVATPRLAPRHLNHLVVLALTATAMLGTNHLVAFLTADPRFALAGPVQESAIANNERLQYLSARPILNTLPGVAETSAPGASAEVESPPQRYEIVAYAVQPGDTLSGIAIRFGLSWETVSWANSLPNVNSLRVGQELTIPHVDGYPYTVKWGDTVGSLSSRYKSESAEIIAVNNLPSPDALFVGQLLILPGGRPPPPPPPPAPARVVVESAPSAPSSAGFVAPLVGLLTQYFGYGHEGVDIARPHGTPVQAAGGGRVVEARKLGYSYGWYLIIDHGNGFQTMYAHMSAFLVDLGEDVEAGQVIGRVGITGRSTGPHLHFELHLNGRPVNPLNYLP